MPTTSPSPTARPAPTPVLVRSRSDRVVAGVAGGLATRIGVEPVLVRLAFALLALAAGTGLAAYALLWALLPERDVAPPRLGDQARTEHAVAVGLITLGLVLLAQALLPWLFFERLVWPATLAAVGLGVTWERTGEAERTRWRGIAARLPTNPVDVLTDGRAMVIRAAFGFVLVLVGVGSFLVSSRSFDALGQVAITMVVTAAGVALLLGPWIARLVRQLGVERRERIRSEERAEVAAHLHDSVLQTLTLIQRTAGSPHETVSLARRQERELRAWLYGDRSPTAATIAAALDELVDEVEALHEVTVEVVTVGDAELDDRLRALVAAIREAVVNAARHSGTSQVAVYVECDAEATTAYVRDRGTGFDLDAVPADRRGIADSIVGRMARHGGHAEVRTEPGGGTEVVLVVPGAGR